ERNALVRRAARVERTQPRFARLSPVGCALMDTHDLLRCPVTHESLADTGDALVSVPSGRRYERDAHGIPLFARDAMTEEARVQQAHYDRIAAAYFTNLGYPHTQEYMAYFDRAVLDAIDGSVGVMAEICCGGGEACWLLRDRVRRAVGVD